MKNFFFKLSGVFKKESITDKLLITLEPFAVGRIIKNLPEDAKYKPVTGQEEWLISEYNEKTKMVTIFLKNLPENIRYQEKISLEKLIVLNKESTPKFDVVFLNKYKDEFNIKTIESFEQLFELLKKSQKIITESGKIYPADYLEKVIQGVIDKKDNFDINNITNTLNLRGIVKSLIAKRNIDMGNKFNIK